eukprot:TRINITY_DN67820_c0_g2_i1.p2 TRINITY_DN67820_c0_g2~~TRINITY_DN67820_c0_g2_i1.p2  ORF type:complete len:100 (-),score=11.60 TRINITY_DN67820_c0_g2_i1:59-358(-)
MVQDAASNVDRETSTMELKTSPGMFMACATEASLEIHSESAGSSHENEAYTSAESHIATTSSTAQSPTSSEKEARTKSRAALAMSSKQPTSEQASMSML